MVTVLERVLFLLNERRKYDPRAREEFLAAVGQGDMEGALRISDASKFYVVRTLGYALQHRETSLANALLYAQEKELKRFRRGIPVLDTVITLAPLLGLLGTVTGMMRSFSLIGGELSAPGAITGGIAEALIATAFGLSIAITSLIPFNILNTRMEEARHEIESAAKELELLVHPAGGSEAPEAPAAPAGLAHEARDGPNGARNGRFVRKREALQKQMAELKTKIDAQVQEMQHLADQERGLHGLLVRDLPAGGVTMHGGSGGGSQKRARIEIIPLIDIIFFLLATFIMVSLSMTKNQGVQVALPTAASAASLGDQQQMEKAVTLSVTDKGDVFYNKEKITLAQLPLRLQTFKSTAKDPKVIINSDGGGQLEVRGPRPG